MGQYMNRMNKPPAKWITEAMWKECSQLSNDIPAFSGLCSNIAVNSKFWNTFSETDNPYQLLANDMDESHETTEQGKVLQKSRCSKTCFRLLHQHYSSLSF